ncbi:UDP-4-amino-4,6-dideoxy-N-acetyl-beta-L-altrosamine N-acetyltransferase [Halobacillus litoralis]|uniref:UDP-4-amino-4, 6-dideoxy-N-acetyl-beta-L-altrosamine N-acetyltransferase n=1 Tax=Halobacillus litoralis TaxID=45668 RepID=A0A845DV17_9BACI|nr:MULTISPECIES: UDP-4-amino-4,6-dideoxy-N-acetyl-beta-L-altrosamine N-acetyltransferase [Halobacillus]MYL21513.1 UDP-4-amino-4,6-dideoxy-N-acetyl-beta-L-altrosamine N-acetyltransferase [Halobacillus litoralis]MYL30032.1 UDP-4-amino-4,6-dideoxy-N-acetyl-beta-L-altrosamine N-acetyltransferase [Halobacillus halophilus]
MIQFERLKEDHLDLVLKWRTSSFVTRYMYTDIDGDRTKHQAWFESISQSETDLYWVAVINAVPVGVISLSDIHHLHKRATFGYYIGEEKYRIYGGILPLYLYNHVFTNLSLNKLTAEVMEGNDKVVKLNMFHGFQMVGTRKEHVIKHGKSHDVHLMELLKSDWEKKGHLFKKYTGAFE